MNSTGIFQGFKNFQDLEGAIFNEHPLKASSSRFAYKEQYFYTYILGYYNEQALIEKNWHKC